jgi:nucleotide-binding universal stress UspA family protein
MYRKILIATDGSDLANKAVDHGVMLAKGTGASVVFVTVTENWSAIAMGAESTQGMSNPIESYEAIATKRAQNILAAAKTAAKDAGIECETVHVPDQPPAEGIIETANEKGCDLIVMASHGRRGLNRLVLGSQTTEVLACSKVPVLVLR